MKSNATHQSHYHHRYIISSWLSSRLCETITHEAIHSIHSIIYIENNQIISTSLLICRSPILHQIWEFHPCYMSWIFHVYVRPCTPAMHAHLFRCIQFIFHFSFLLLPHIQSDAPCDHHKPSHGVCHPSIPLQLSNIHLTTSSPHEDVFDPICKCFSPFVYRWLIDVHTNERE